MAEQRFRAFVSSPGDAIKERKIALEIIEKINVKIDGPLDMTITRYFWEEQNPGLFNMPDKKVQETLNTEAARAHFFILIFHEKYGRIEQGKTVSNTEREVKAVLAERKKNPRKTILPYFMEGTTLEPKVVELREKLRSLGIIDRSYKSLKEFKDLLTHDLYSTAMSFKLSTDKIDALKKFWNFRRPNEGDTVSAAIMFNPYAIEKFFDTDVNRFNHISMAPCYEVFRAIRKIDKTLRKAGKFGFGVFSTDNEPGRFESTNKIWVGGSRMKQGSQNSYTLHASSTIEVAPRGKNKPAKITFKNMTGIVNITSPLKFYLEAQRVEMSEFDYRQDIIAKDFGVLARYKDPKSSVTYDSAKWDYFFVGLRGLGTWGAAWYLDRCTRELVEKLIDDKNLEIILEVTYKNGAIASVEDVTTKGQEYFSQATSKSSINGEIQKFKNYGSL